MVLARVSVNQLAFNILQHIKIALIVLLLLFFM